MTLLRFAGLITCFTAILLFLWGGSFESQWQTHPDGSSQLSVHLDLKLPRPLTAQINQHMSPEAQQHLQHSAQTLFKNVTTDNAHRTSQARPFFVPVPAGMSLPPLPQNNGTPLINRHTTSYYHHSGGVLD